jgi:hypothetical protein
MKHLMLVLALVLGVSLGLAQGFIYTTPPICNTTVASCVLIVGNPIVTVAGNGFSGTVVGQKVFGVGVPYGTTVKAIDGQGGTADSVTLSAAPTIGGSKSLQFGYFDGTDYTSGDWLGRVFRVYTYPGNGDVRLLVSIQIVDQADTLGDCDVALFSSFSDTLGLDNSAASILASESFKLVGVVSLTTVKDLGATRILQSSNVGVIVPKENLYARLITRAAYAPATIADLRVRFGFW